MTFLNLAVTYYAFMGHTFALINLMNVLTYKNKIMKLKVYLIAVTIVMTSLSSSVSAQRIKDKSFIAEYQKVQISNDMKDLVTVKCADSFGEGKRKMKTRVYKESGKLLFSHISHEKGDTRVDYDISQFPAGNYTFEISKNGVSVYSKVIVKQASNAIANTVLNLDGQKDSTNLLLSKN